MNRPALLFAVLLFFAASVQTQTITWSQPQAIGQASTTDGLRPRVAIAANGEINVIWGRDSLQGEILHVRMVGGSFTIPALISDPAHDVEVAASVGPNIAAKGNDIYVAYGTRAPNTGELFTLKSSDAGNSWASPVWLDQYLFGNYAVFPHVAIDGDDHPHAAMLRNSGSWSTGAICSVNQGVSYTAFIPSDGTVPGSPCNTTDPFIAIEDDKHVVLWRQQIGNDHPIYAALSTNNGATFSVRMNMDDGNAQDVACNISGPEAIIVGDSLIYAWVSPDDNGRVKCGSADMVALNPSTPRTMDQGTTASSEQSQPTIAGDATAFGVSWVDDRSGTEDVYFAWSTGGPTGLTAGDPLFTGQVARHSPSLAFQDSTFHLVYVDEGTGNVMYVSGSVDLGTMVHTRPASSSMLQLWPVPTSGELNWRWNGSKGTAQVRVVDLTGVVVLSKETASRSGTMSLDLGQLAVGTYVVEVSVAGEVAHQRMELIH